MATEAMVLSNYGGGSSASRGPSALRRWYERNGGLQSSAARARLQVVHSGKAVRQGAESLVVGGALGALHAKLPEGLDLKSKVPLDAVVGAVGLVGSVVLAGDESASTLRNAGAAAASIFAFRKMNDFIAKKLAESGKTSSGMHGEGDFGEDPIIAIAKDL